MFRQSVQTMKRRTIWTVANTAVVIGALEITTHLPSQGRSSQFYHYVCDEWVTPTLRKFTGPEVAHQIAIQMTKYGFSPYYRPSAVEQRVSVSQTLFDSNIQFANPIGLAAGFDKDGDVIKQMLELGFGFVEIGTVTPLPQPGNPKPRMFRLVQDHGIINRYGFNSKGSEYAEHNLQEFRASYGDGEGKEKDNKKTSSDSDDDEEQQGKVMRLLKWLWYTMYPSPPPTGLVGVNIGKNKTSDDAVADYVFNIQKLGKYADFMVINVSSPNTAGLRDLQETSALKQLLLQCMEARSKTLGDEPPVPLLVKLAPDLSDEELQSIGLLCLEIGIDGIVITNTTNQRPNDLISKQHLIQEIGGLSGAPLRDKSTECIRQMYQYTEGKIPIIGVGGVGSGQDAYEKLKAGASLIEVYSMMVFKGPGMVSRIRHELADIMIQNGKRSIDDVIGCDHEEIFWRRREEQKLQTRRRKSQSVVFQQL